MQTDLERSHQTQHSAFSDSGRKGKFSCNVSESHSNDQVQPGGTEAASLSGDYRPLGHQYVERNAAFGTRRGSRIFRHASEQLHYKDQGLCTNIVPRGGSGVERPSYVFCITDRTPDTSVIINGEALQLYKHSVAMVGKSLGNGRGIDRRIRPNRGNCYRKAYAIVLALFLGCGTTLAFDNTRLRKENTELRMALNTYKQMFQLSLKELGEIQIA
jgi:hypothetical protein